jgi:hypothetical protein
MFKLSGNYKLCNMSWDIEYSEMSKLALFPFSKLVEMWEAIQLSQKVCKHGKYFGIFNVSRHIAQFVISTEFEHGIVADLYQLCYLLSHSFIFN